MIPVKVWIHCYSAKYNVVHETWLNKYKTQYTHHNFNDRKSICKLGLCDMDKKYISRFFDFFSDFDFNHDFDTNRHALSYTSCFCTSYLSCTSCFALFFILLHILLFISFFTYIYIYIYIYALVWRYFYIIFILCTVHWADLIWSTFHFWLYPV